MTAAAKPDAAKPAAAKPAPAPRFSKFAIAVAILLAVAVITPLLITDYHALQLTNLLCYAIAIVGLNLLTGFSGQISLGNSAFWALGAYTSVICVSRGIPCWASFEASDAHWYGFDITLITTSPVPYWLTPVVAGGVCYVVGYLFGRTATRLEGLYLALATFALSIVTPQLLKLDVLEGWTGGTQGISIDKPTTPELIGSDTLSDDKWLYFFTLAIAIILFTVARRIVRGRTGRALVALRDHSIAAGTMGIDVVSYKSRAFGLSAMFTGIAGTLFTITSAYASPDSYPPFLSIQLLVGSIVGGIASIFGALFGAAFIEFVPDLAKGMSDAAPQAIFGILLIVCMRVMPYGMAGLVYTLELRFARAVKAGTKT